MEYRRANADASMMSAREARPELEDHFSRLATAFKTNPIVREAIIDGFIKHSGVARIPVTTSTYQVSNWRYHPDIRQSTVQIIRRDQTTKYEELVIIHESGYSPTPKYQYAGPISPDQQELSSEELARKKAEEFITDIENAGKSDEPVPPSSPLV